VVKLAKNVKNLAPDQSANLRFPDEGRDPSNHQLNRPDQFCTAIGVNNPTWIPIVIGMTVCVVYVSAPPNPRILGWSTGSRAKPGKSMVIGC